MGAASRLGLGEWRPDLRQRWPHTERGAATTPTAIDAARQIGNSFVLLAHNVTEAGVPLGTRHSVLDRHFGAMCRVDTPGVLDYM
jgi:hypothetical protein